MYLHEAIRLGSMVTGQMTRSAMSPDGMRTCAMGAALLATGLANNYDEMKLLNLGPSGMLGNPKVLATFPILRGGAVLISLPLHGGLSGSASIGYAVMTLNDFYCWSREKIADWLEPIELAYYMEHPDLLPVGATQPADPDEEDDDEDQEQEPESPEEAHNVTVSISVGTIAGVLNERSKAESRSYVVQLRALSSATNRMANPVPVPLIEDQKLEEVGTI